MRCGGLEGFLKVCRCCGLYVGGPLVSCNCLTIDETAHVGTLVLTAPVRATDPTIGQVIGFHPPTAPAQEYTLRIVSIDSGAIYTRHNIDGAPDRWLLTGADIIERRAQ